MSCAVIVVPMLAPKMTEIAWGRDISPALTKPMVITVVAELLCSTAVTNAPANAPITGFLVSTPRILRILSPATFCRLSLMLFMPYRNMASPPNNAKNIFTVSFIPSPDRRCAGSATFDLPRRFFTACHAHVKSRSLLWFVFTSILS